jgi:hypothetical protein
MKIRMRNAWVPLHNVLPDKGRKLRDMEDKQAEGTTL